MASEILARLAVLVVIVLALLCALDKGRDEESLEAALRGFFLGLLGGAGAVLALAIVAWASYYVLTGQWVEG